MSLYGVLSVDPGKTSGVVFLTWTGSPIETPNIQYSMESSPEDYATHVLGSLRHWKNYDDFLVVCERFVINTQTAKNSQAPYSLEQIGVLKHLCRENQYSVDKIKFQAPVDAKRMFPNQTLKDLGVWHRGGAGHANDALRHALLGMARNGWVPDQLLYKNT